MFGRQTPKVSCEVCREWLTNEFGRKLRRRGETETPDCAHCPQGFKWVPEAVSVLHLFNLCFDPVTLGFRHLPRNGGVLEQNPVEMAYLEITRKILLEHKDRQRQLEEGKKNG